MVQSSKRGRLIGALSVLGGCQRLGCRGLFAIESLKDIGYFVVVLLNFGQGLLDVGQRSLVIRFLHRARFILARTVVLDLLASVLYLGQAQSGRGTLEEVTKLGEFSQILS